MPKTINNRARTKHVGHACEGHLAGIVEHYAKIHGFEVSRALPIETHVKPDVVLLDNSGKVRAIFIVAYWENSDNSHIKLYRTRSEIEGIHSLQSQRPEIFGQAFHILTVIYGADGGWKPQVLEDLKSIETLIYLPNEIGALKAHKVCEESYSLYLARYALSDKDPRQSVQLTISERALKSDEKIIYGAISDVLDSCSSIVARSALTSIASLRLPQSVVRTRYRQGLGILSCFSQAEIASWYDRPVVDSRPSAHSFAKRAWFLGVGTLEVTRSLVASRRGVRLALASPYDQDGRYKPDFPDFSSWLQLSRPDCEWIVRSHQERSRDGGEAFAGGAFDQCAGNFEDISATLLRELPAICKAARHGKHESLVRSLLSGVAVTAPPWHPASGVARLFPGRFFVACALAMQADDRRLRRELSGRSQEPIVEIEADLLAKSLIGARAAIDLLEELSDALKILSLGSLDELATLSRPRLLQIREEPASWLADVYNTLTTNSSHNPLNEVLLRWMKIRFPGSTWSGWPEKRSVRVSEVLSAAAGRREWTMLAIVNGVLIGAEAKAITSNNWGNKSKELYDRVSELRKVGEALGHPVRSILLFDGDLEQRQLTELSTGIGHDEIWSVDEVLSLLGQKN